jgi:hypothetical protein
MSFKFACPHCGQRISATPEDVGTAGGCPSCQQEFTVPSPPAPVVVEQKTAVLAPTIRAAAVARFAAPTAEPEVPSVTKRGLGVFALLLSILPVLNFAGLGMAIFAVVRSDRPGRSGERGVAVTAVTIASLLLWPVNAGAVGAVMLLSMSHRPKPVVTVQKATPSPRATPLSH